MHWVAESALRGTLFGNIPEEINRDYIEDLRRISEAFAAPLSNLFAFAKQEHKLCPFIPQNQLALYANPLFWQYGRFAFVSRCCAHNNQHRSQMASAAKAVLTKQDKSSEKDVDALTFMQTMENKRCPSMISLSIFQCSWFQPSSQPWSSNALRRWK